MRRDNEKTYTNRNMNPNRDLALASSIEPYARIVKDKFILLNKEKAFPNKIDWNFSGYGRLWTFNLNYFEYLNREETDKDTGIRLIHAFIENVDSTSAGMEAYPTSLRCINWIKFLVRHHIEDAVIDMSLYSQYMRLIERIEYHLLGNHLLENGFSLLFGACFFSEFRLYKKAKRILLRELTRQILSDGGHFELSPMYHQIVLFRTLDCINLLQNNDHFNSGLLCFFEEKAELMLDYLRKISFNNAEIPLFNDSAKGVAPTTRELLQYAAQLGLPVSDNNNKTNHGTSNYLKRRTDKYEMVIDVGDIGPDYLPAHAHSDTFTFELYIGGEPAIVDTGTSTYEENERRYLERSTKAHNTVQLDNCEQNEIWGSFRVARRAKVIRLEQSENRIEAVHNGYKRLKTYHTRRIDFLEEEIAIHDTMDDKERRPCFSYIHFHPRIVPTVKGTEVALGTFSIDVNGADTIRLDTYEYAPEFNKRIPGIVLIIDFTESVSLHIKIA